MFVVKIKSAAYFKFVIINSKVETVKYDWDKYQN